MEVSEYRRDDGKIRERSREWCMVGVESGSSSCRRENITGVGTGEDGHKSKPISRMVPGDTHHFVAHVLHIDASTVERSALLMQRKFILVGCSPWSNGKADQKGKRL